MPHHPDELDAKASAEGPKLAASARATPNEVEKVLLLFADPAGRARLPRKQLQKQIALAAIAMALQRYRAYTEQEVNGELKRLLDASGWTTDHVTCRRALIDYGFVRRDRSGNRYIADYAQIDKVLSPESAQRAHAVVSELTQ